MTTEITTPPEARETRKSVLVEMAGKYSVEPNKLLETLKNTAFKNASDDQMIALCVVANEYGLNPFTKEIYAFPAKGGGIVPVIGADGWYSMVNANPNFDGAEFSENWDDDGNLISTTCTIHRKDRSHPCVITEYVAENKRNTDPWNLQPARMNRHRAFIQCARIAFAISLSDPEDAERTKVYESRAAESRTEDFSNEQNPFEATATATVETTTEAPETLAHLMQRDSIAENELLIALADEDICEADISGLDQLTSDQESRAVENWNAISGAVRKGAA